jgi:ribonuclease D
MKRPANNPILIDVGTLQGVSSTMQMYILQMAEQGKVLLFDPLDVSGLYASPAMALMQDKPYISVADTCRLLNGEITIPGLGKINIM